MGHAIEVRGLSKTFRAGRKALDDVSLQVGAGEMVALLGASGSGKSTLLRHLAGFVPADAGSGSIAVNGRIIQQGGRLARDVRQARRQIGFVFQQFNLVGRLPVITNVLMGMLPRVPAWRSLLKIFRQGEVQAGLSVLAQVGIDDYAFQRASTLSGGQQQRAAIARTLIQDARVIPADPLVWRADLPADLKQKLRDFFVNYGKAGADAERQMANLNRLTYKGFRVSDNTQLIPIRQMELAKERARIAGDASLKADDKARMEAEIDGRLAALDKQLAQAGAKQ